jgi:AraC family transcriptional activator of mtrCDE
MNTLEVEFVGLSQCLVSRGYRLDMAGEDAPGIHYCLAGRGRIFIGREPPIALEAHNLIVVPPNAPFRIEAAAAGAPVVKQVDGRRQRVSMGGVRCFAAGEGPPDIVLICGYFHAFYGGSIELFGMLSSPIVEQFTVDDRLDRKLSEALAELMSQEVGTGAMSATLLKQVIIALLRRTLSSTNHWVERFSMLSDPQISRAFAGMAADPGAAHTVQSLAQRAGLSRSAFMARFTEVVGQPPMSVLRELRMRQAAQQLRANLLSTEQIARDAGYASRSSFVRAFRAIYGCDPVEYKARNAASVSPFHP